MKKEQLNRLLNTACEIISALEGHADDLLKKEIDALFNEIVYSEDIDDEMRINYSADDEAQDWDVFGDDKI
jgi:hypothetical protein